MIKTKSQKKLNKEQKIKKIIQAFINSKPAPYFTDLEIKKEFEETVNLVLVYIKMKGKKQVSNFNFVLRVLFYSNPMFDKLYENINNLQDETEDLKAEIEQHEGDANKEIEKLDNENIKLDDEVDRLKAELKKLKKSIETKLNS